MFDQPILMVNNHAAMLDKDEYEQRKQSTNAKTFKPGLNSLSLNLSKGLAEKQNEDS